MSTDLETLKKKIVAFREDRDWKQFHNPKNLALSICIEASELMELYQWLDMEQSQEFSEKNKEEIGKELADIFNYLLLFSNDLDIDLMKVTDEKIKENNKKYPVIKSKGKSTKYNKL